jgi:hypothetical protein
MCCGPATGTVAARPVKGSDPALYEREVPMQTETTRRLVVHLFSVLRRGCGLLLVMAACAGVALAQSSMKGGCDTHAPEIDAGSVVSGLTLLTGGVLLLTDRFRRK